MVNLTKNEPIVRSDGPIALVGGGEIGPDDLNLVLNRVTGVVAVDGGVAALTDSGRIPDAVIGDFDSLDPKSRERVPADRLFHTPEQDSTDFDKALQNVQAPLVLGAGFLGGRLDHQVAALNTLVRFEDRICILLGPQEVVFHAPPRISIETGRDALVSLFPLRRVTGRSTGLFWPIENLVFQPDGRIGTSNRSVDARIELQVDGPGLVVMVPRTAFDSVMQAFASGQTGRWPSRAG